MELPDRIRGAGRGSVAGGEPQEACLSCMGLTRVGLAFRV